ncbi:hypothetical protein V5O48_012768 [Marasmius crinis-equi]|uniref:Allantoin permease n=1 Tax=Marasmius crinis-equi TaxID=585013 RepID=A0ABR3F1X5_9AGAR
MRAVICVIWNGVNTFYAGRLVDVCLQCIWPSWAHVANTLPLSSGITTRQLASSWFIFQCLTLFHPKDLRWFYLGKSIVVLVAMHGILGWWIHRNGGVNFASQRSIDSSSPSQEWLWLQAFNSGFGTISSLTVNQADIARYSRKPNDQLWGQVLMFPIASALPGLYGILVASASKELYGKPLWNLWDVCQAMLNEYPNNAGARFGVFLAAGSMALALIAVNLSTNCLPFGSDLTALFPKYMTIKRGQFICCLAGLVIAPWKILKNGQTFLAFLSGYGYWLAPGAAILCVDYYLTLKGNIVTSELYNGYPNGIAPSVKISEDAKHMSNLSFIVTYLVAAAMYYLSYKIWPLPRQVQETLAGLRFEALADALDEEERERRLGTDSLESDKDSVRNVYVVP